MSDTELLRELARIKALFQARSIAAVMGVPVSQVTTPIRRLDEKVWGAGCNEENGNG